MFNIFEKIELPKEKDQILIDYFDRVIGTEEINPYFEIVIYTYDENNLLLKIFNDGGSEEEKINDYLISHDSYYEIYKLIKDNKIDKWNKLKKKYSLNGRIYVLKYFDGNELIRVSSEHMPEDGTKAFNDIYNKLLEYIK